MAQHDTIKIAKNGHGFFIPPSSVWMWIWECCWCFFSSIRKQCCMCRTEINAERNAVQENKRENHANRKKKNGHLFSFHREKLTEGGEKESEIREALTTTKWHTNPNFFNLMQFISRVNLFKKEKEQTFKLFNVSAKSLVI